MDERKITARPDYEKFSVEDFAADPEFIQWVKYPHGPVARFWQQWLEQHPQKQMDVEEAKELVRSVDFIKPLHGEEARQSVWDRIKQTNSNLNPVPHMEPVASSPAPVLSRPFAWWKLAAASAGTLIVTALLLYTLQQRSATYRTAFGETRQVFLPDGSVVVLNANSSMRLGDAWETDREVWLEGEAFFTVKKTAAASKFTVHTRALDVNVLGTEFTVSERRRTRVILNTGKIALTLHHEQRETIAMEPGEMVEVTTGHKVVRRAVNPRQYSAWKDHEWILDGLTIEQVGERLSETFGLPVQIKHGTGPGREVTGVVPTDNLDILLKALTAAFERDFVRHDDRIVVE